jgi:hypothetical protein
MQKDDNSIQIVGGEGAESEWNPRESERRAFQQFATLTRTKRMLEQELDRIKDELDALSFQLRDYLGTGGFERVRIDGFTIYLRRQIFARKYDWATATEVCAALNANGMGHSVKEQYNSHTLSKHIRELEELHEEELRDGRLANTRALLPKAVARVLNIEPSYTVVAVET